MTYLHVSRPSSTLAEKARIQDELPSAIKTTLHFHFFFTLYHTFKNDNCMGSKTAYWKIFLLQQNLKYEIFGRDEIIGRNEEE